MGVSILYDEHGNVTSVAFSEFDPEPEYEYKIRLREKTVDRMDLALWLRKTGYQCTYSQTLYIADCLIRGETWRPPCDSLKVENNPYCDIEVINAND